jgi:enamine deaminase RidA (YjgF/YER057c/UK114 family)
MAEIKRIGMGKRLSNAVVHGGLVYFAGQVADDPTADVVEQARQVLANIDKVLAEVGSTKTKLLTATIWLADIKDFAAVNSIWDPWVPQGHTPARACVESKLATPQYRVEIGGIAAL